MKKVAIIADGWKKFMNYAWIDGARQYIKEHDLDVTLHIFHSFGSYSMDEKYNIGEYNIMELPDLAEYDGIILELTNVTNVRIREKILDKALKSGVPTVSLLEQFEGCLFSGTDNYTAMTRLVEHLIDVHGCRVLDFVGGSPDNSENRTRFEAYKDVLRAHNIPYDEKRTFFRDFEIGTGIDAFDHFYKQGELPQAFVCANDNIAVGICHRAEELGFQVPRDFLVTGYDNFDKASNYRPRITTAGFVREDVISRAMGLLHETWEGTRKSNRAYADVEYVFQDSCGCEPKKLLSRGQYVVDRIFAEYGENKIQNIILELKRELINCESFAEMADCLPRHNTDFHYEEMYILLNEEIMDCGKYAMIEHEKEREYRIHGYPDTMQILLASGGAQVQMQMKKEFCTKQLIPGQGEDNREKGGSIYLFSPLHFRDREVGYVVIKNCEYLLCNQMLFEMLEAFQETMENVYQRRILRKMNQELSSLYICDSLTGLYNRMAYSRLAEPLFAKCMDQGKSLLILFADLDRLKYINDTYGHDMGNLAIRTISGALQKCCPRDAVAMRYGGDEFVVLVPEYSEVQAKTLKRQILDEIKVQEALHKTGFPIDASIGYVIAQPGTPMSLNDCINLADERMYTVKKAKKVQRI
jgi:diguanylate cyclase (GGDEF)-like protein